VIVNATTRSILADHGLNCTAQRAALYEALAATKSHPTAEELYQRVRPDTRSLSLATVYSALETFCRVGLARRVPTDGSARYDATTHDHVHVRDLETGAVTDVPGELGGSILAHVPPSVLDDIEQRMGVKIEGLDIQILARRDE
jgi:Fur family peroxide stress response transcriptional regulator